MSIVSTDWLANNLAKVKVIDSSWHMPNSNKDPYKEFNGYFGAMSTYGSFSYLKYGPIRLFSQLAQDSDLKVGKLIWVAGHSGPETAEDSRTHFGIFSPGVTQLFPKGHIINLEKALKYGERISGHFVQGHVDTTASVKKINLVGKSWQINFKLSKKFKKYLIQKGSVTINGVSLTIAKILIDGFQIVVIPQTLWLTNLILLKEKDVANIEFDVVGKYIKNFLKRR